MKRIGWQFIQQTKYPHLEKADQSRGLPPPPLEVAPDPARPVIGLPDPRRLTLGGAGVREVIDQRRSLRTYTQAPLTLEELSYLLWCTQGVQEVRPRVWTLRTVPSAGARHAFETFVLANNVAGLPGGLYRFLASKHGLVEADRTPSLRERAVDACLGQEFVGDAAATFIWTAVVYRMTWRYEERGYRYLYLDAGHVCQNLYLAAESIGCGACAVAAFSDDDMDRLLGLDGESQFVIYLAAVGKK